MAQPSLGLDARHCPLHNLPITHVKSSATPLQRISEATRFHPLHSHSVDWINRHDAESEI